MNSRNWHKGKRKTERERKLCLYIVSVAHSPPTLIIGGICGCQGLKEGGKILTFDAGPSCSDKILKLFSAHSTAPAPLKS